MAPQNGPTPGTRGPKLWKAGSHLLIDGFARNEFTRAHAAKFYHLKASDQLPGAYFYSHTYFCPIFAQFKLRSSRRPVCCGRECRRPLGSFLEMQSFAIETPTLPAKVPTWGKWVLWFFLLVRDTTPTPVPVSPRNASLEPSH